MDLLSICYLLEALDTQGTGGWFLWSLDVYDTVDQLIEKRDRVIDSYDDKTRFQFRAVPYMRSEPIPV